MSLSELHFKGFLQRKNFDFVDFIATKDFFNENIVITKTFTKQKQASFTGRPTKLEQERSF